MDEYYGGGFTGNSLLLITKRHMNLSTRDEEILISQSYAEFRSVATNGERSILLAVARVRNSVIRNSNPAEVQAGKRQVISMGFLFPQCAHILRQTAAWAKISERERKRMERELLALPEIV